MTQHNPITSFLRTTGEVFTYVCTSDLFDSERLCLLIPFKLQVMLFHHSTFSCESFYPEQER